MRVEWEVGRGDPCACGTISWGKIPNAWIIKMIGLEEARYTGIVKLS